MLTTPSRHIQLENPDLNLYVAYGWHLTVLATPQLHTTATYSCRNTATITLYLLEVVLQAETFRRQLPADIVNIAMSAFGQGISAGYPDPDASCFTAIANDKLCWSRTQCPLWSKWPVCSWVRPQKEIVGNGVKVAASSTREHGHGRNDPVVPCTTTAQESQMSMFRDRMLPLEIRDCL